MQQPTALSKSTNRYAALGLFTVVRLAVSSNHFKANYMKTNELRIGNYAKGLFDETVSLKAIYEDGTLAWQDGKGTIYGPMKPIGLTEGWLMEFEFKNCCDLWGWYIDNFELQEMEDVDGNFTGYGYAIDGVVEDLVIKYVHQLQNLYFAITGKDLQSVE